MNWKAIKYLSRLSPAELEKIDEYEGEQLGMSWFYRISLRLKMIGLNFHYVY